MERSFRASNGLYVYVFLLALTGLLLAVEATQRLRAGAVGWGVLLWILAVTWLGCGAALLYAWGRLRITLTSDSLHITGSGPDRRIVWRDVERIKEYRGPAYQLSLRGLLPGPYLPHGLLRGETVLV